MISVRTFEDHPSGDSGCFDKCEKWGGSRGVILRLDGWARDPATGRPGRTVIITDENRHVLAEARVFECRRDVAAHYHNPTLSQCGWSVFLPTSELADGLHLLSAYTVDPEVGIAYKLAGSFPISLPDYASECSPPSGTVREIGQRSLTREENLRLNLEEQVAGRTKLASYPTLVLLELTARCNLNCIMCARYNTDLDGHLSDEMYQQVKDKLYPFARTAILSCRTGEPALYPKFEQAIEDVRSYGLQGVLTTNATVLKEEHIRKLVDAGFNVRFSVDGATARTFHMVRGAALSTVARHIQQFTSYARSSGNPQVETGVTFTPMIINVHEIPDMVDLITDWGVDGLYVQKFAVQNAYTNKNWGPDADPVLMKALCDEALRRAVQRNVTFEVAGNRMYERKIISPAGTPVARTREPDMDHLGCTRPFSDAIVYMDGAVVPCCLGAPPMGYLTHQTFEEIWNGENWSELRRQLAEGDPPDYCRKCHLLKTTGREVARPAPASNLFTILPETVPRNLQGEPVENQSSPEVAAQFQDLHTALERNTAAIESLLSQTKSLAEELSTLKSSRKDSYSPSDVG